MLTSIAKTMSRSSRGVGCDGRRYVRLRATTGRYGRPPGAAVGGALSGSRMASDGVAGSPLISVAQPKAMGRARASVSEPLRAYAIGKIATGKLRAGPAHGIPVAILPGPEACGLETAGLLLISSCLINRLALEACASLATRNACSGVLGRLRPNPGRRQASVTPAPRLRSWLAS